MCTTACAGAQKRVRRDARVSVWLLDKRALLESHAKDDVEALVDLVRKDAASGSLRHPSILRLHAPPEENRKCARSRHRTRARVHDGRLGQGREPRGEATRGEGGRFARNLGSARRRRRRRPNPRPGAAAAAARPRGAATSTRTAIRTATRRDPPRISRTSAYRSSRSSTGRSSSRGPSVSPRGREARAPRVRRRRRRAHRRGPVENRGGVSATPSPPTGTATACCTLTPRAPRSARTGSHSTRSL